ncbi:MAG TPA: MFS transporter [Dongiaceae bacterium]|jgi:MFS family permease
MRRTHPFIFLNLAHFFDHYFMLIFPTAVLAIHVEWGMGYGETLWLGTAAAVALGVATLPAGWLGDRWRRSSMMVIFFIGLGLSGIAAGFATGPVSLTVALAAIGIFAGIYHPVAIAAVVRLAHGSGRAIAVNGVFGNMGFAGAAVITGLLTATFGWRSAFIVPGVASILLGLMALRYMGRDVDVPKDEPAARIATADMRSALVRVFAFVAAAAVFGGLIFNGITVAVPKLFEQQIHLADGSLMASGALAAVAFAIAAFAQLPTGRLLDRYGAKPVALFILALQVPALALVGQIWGLPLMGVTIAALLLVFGEIPVTDWLIGRHIAGAWQSRIFAVNYLFSLGVSALTFPMIGILYDLSGDFRILFLSLAACAAAVLATALALPGRRPASVPAPAE